MKFCVLILALACQAQAVKFWTQVVPATAGVTTVMVNAGSIWSGIKKTPKVIASTPKGPKAMIKAAKKPKEKK